MSRSGYIDDCEEQWDWIRWRGAVKSALRGKRGQAFLREMLAALDGLESRRLIADELEIGGEVCALGAVGKARGIEMGGIDPTDHESIAGVFGISGALACEIMWLNDEDGPFKQTPEERFQRLKKWAEAQIETNR